MASNTTSPAVTSGVNVDDWVFRNLPAVILYYTKIILVFLARAIGVILSLAIVLTILFLLVVGVVHAVSYLWSLRYKGKKPSQGCADGENVPLQDRMDGEEEAAERLLTGKGCKADVDGEVIDGAEPLSEEQLPRYDGMSLPSHQQSQVNIAYMPSKLQRREGGIRS